MITRSKDFMCSVVILSFAIGVLGFVVCAYKPATLNIEVKTLEKQKGRENNENNIRELNFDINDDEGTKKALCCGISGH